MLNLCKSPVCNGHVLEKNINDHLDSGCKRYLLDTKSDDMAGPSKGKSSTRRSSKSGKDVSLAPIFSQAKSKRPAPPSSPEYKDKDEIEISDTEGGSWPSTSKSDPIQGGRPPPLKKPRTTLSNLQAAAPLAERMRPQTLDEVIGHEHITGRDSLLRGLMSGGGTGSLILVCPSIHPTEPDKILICAIVGSGRLW